MPGKSHGQRNLSMATVLGVAKSWTQPSHWAPCSLGVVFLEISIQEGLELQQTPALPCSQWCSTSSISFTSTFVGNSIKKIMDVLPKIYTQPLRAYGVPFLQISLWYTSLQIPAFSAARSSALCPLSMVWPQSAVFTSPVRKLTLCKRPEESQTFLMSFLFLRNWNLTRLFVHCLGTVASCILSVSYLFPGMDHLFLLSSLP